MKYTSQTGLLSSVTKHTKREQKHVMFNLEVDAKHAPFTTKPFTGLFNPFARGCSILCNHPAVPEVKKMLQRAKGYLGEEGKSVILPDDVAAIRAELEVFQLKNKGLYSGPSNQVMEQPDITEIVPEEMFRKYTETDSRPLTPTPTLASAHTRASATRRCVTPDPIVTSEIKEKTLLVLDLRRSHSQETLSCYGGSTSMNEMPLIRIMNVNLTPASSRHSLLLEKRQQHGNNMQLFKNMSKSPRTLEDDKTRLQFSSNNLNVPVDDLDDQDDPNSDNNEEYIKRRGRKRKKRRASSSVSIFRTTTDPETLVAGLTTESKNPSARPSLNEQHLEDMSKFVKDKLDSDRCFNVDSFLDYESLRQLRRELTNEVVDMEFDVRRKIALEEALKTITNMRVDCDELKQLQKHCFQPQIDSNFRFSIPQKFSRGSVRFELPMDSRVLNHMTPMEYIQDHVYISSARKLLYVFVFNLYRIRPVIDEGENIPSNDPQLNNKESDVKDGSELHLPVDDIIREISGTNIIPALGVLMNKPLNETQATNFHALMGWLFDATYSFRTFSAICAICERLLAAEFYPNLPGRQEDPCEAIEIIDFESLEKKTKGKVMDERLLKLLHMLKVA